MLLHIDHRHIFGEEDAEKLSILPLLEELERWTQENLYVGNNFMVFIRLDPICSCKTEVTIKFSFLRKVYLLF